MTQQRTQRAAQIVVGVDRIGTHDHAVLTAAFEHARRAHADLRIVHAISIDAQRSQDEHPGDAQMQGRSPSR